MASLMSIIRGAREYVVSSLQNPIVTFMKVSVEMIKSEMVTVGRSIATVITILVIGKKIRKMDGARRST